MRTVMLLVLVLSSLAAQSASGRWRQIGTTVTGNPVYLDPKSVTTTNGIVTATIRTTYTKAVATPKGPITASRAIAMFDCAKKQVAVKESIIWHDERKGIIYEKRAPTQPGFGPAFTSNFSGVALAHLCQAPPT
ncbi:MAG: hypothetical protein P3A29_01195 [Gemmatimonadota bacterium]|jgi:hypothetical protein|nr:hypothetical protein [Gemmatimonadota bacterium]